MANSSVVSSNTQFSIDLYKTIIAGNQQEKNVFFSPFSITAALAMVSVGAHGGTKDEIFSGLRLKGQPGSNSEKINLEFKQLFQTLDVQVENSSTSALSSPKDDSDQWTYRRDPPRLDLANRVYLQKGTHVKKPFVDTLQSSYRSTFGEVDIAGNPGAAKNVINKWVANVTHNKIKNLIKELNHDTKLVLVSAIYFKAAWEKAFHSEMTKEKDFFVSGGKTVKADFMSYFSNGEYSYAEFPDLKATAIGILYAGSSFRMLIILPNEKNGLGNLRKSLSPAVFDDSRYSTDVDVDLLLPKFKIEADYHLPKYLQTLGMKKPFLAVADFTGIADSPPLVIGDVVHKSFISIDEKGTEAAAATGVQIEFMSGPPVHEKKVAFNANHPFLFAVQHIQSKVVLFMGELQNPKQN